MTKPVTALPLPVFDAHVDSLQLALDLNEDLAVRTSGHLDLARGARGGLRSVVFVSWVDPLYLAQANGAADRTRALLGAFQRLIERHPSTVRWAGNGELMSAAHAAGCVAGIPGIEGGHSISESLDELQWFFDHGVRVMTLVWNNHLSWIRSCQPGAGADIPLGLSEFGRRVVTCMNELGMVVDVSHAGTRSFFDVLEASSQPVIASHSGCFALHDHPRNLTDEQLRALSAARGAVGIVFCTPFLDADARAAENRMRASDEYRAIEAENATAMLVAQGEFLQAALPPLSIDRVADHVLHAIDRCGIEYVGIGSDFDGIERRPSGLEDASCYPHLAATLVRRGLTSEDVERVFSGNMERLFSEITGAGTRAATAELAHITPRPALTD